MERTKIKERNWYTMSKATKTIRTATGQKERRELTSRQKVEAVLSVWSAARKPTEVCKDLGVQWASLNKWQTKAMEAMLLALEPKKRTEEDRGPALAPRMEKLLSKVEKKTQQFSKLEKRLAGIQEAKQSKEEAAKA